MIVWEVNFLALITLLRAFCKGRRSKTSIYPVFEVILQKTLEQPQREHPGKTGFLDYQEQKQVCYTIKGCPLIKFLIINLVIKSHYHNKF